MYSVSLMEEINVDVGLKNGSWNQISRSWPTFFSKWNKKEIPEKLYMGLLSSGLWNFCFNYGYVCVYWVVIQNRFFFLLWVTFKKLWETSVKEYICVYMCGHDLCTYRYMSNTLLSLLKSSLGKAWITHRSDWSPPLTRSPKGSEGKK